MVNLSQTRYRNIPKFAAHENIVLIMVYFDFKEPQGTICYMIFKNGMNITAILKLLHDVSSFLRYLFLLNGM